MDGVMPNGGVRPGNPDSIRLRHDSEYSAAIAGERGLSAIGHLEDEMNRFRLRHGRGDKARFKGIRSQEFQGAGISSRLTVMKPTVHECMPVGIG